MAIRQHPRENMVQEATAYRRRALVRLPGLTFTGSNIGEAFLGQRESGAWSIYLDELSVLQFNTQGALRRLFLQGRIYFAESGRLVEFSRVARGGKVSSSRVPLDETQECSILDELSILIREVTAKLSQEYGHRYLIAHYPVEDENILADFGQWLSGLPAKITIAQNSSLSR